MLVCYCLGICPSILFCRNSSLVIMSAMSGRETYCFTQCACLSAHPSVCLTQNVSTFVNATVPATLAGSVSGVLSRSGLDVIFRCHFLRRVNLVIFAFSLKTMWILISWLIQRLADLDLHCLKVRCMVRFNRNKKFSSPMPHP